MDVFLHNASSFLICCRFNDYAFDFFVFLANHNTMASICVFTRFNYPNIFLYTSLFGSTFNFFLLILLLFLDFLFFFVVISFEPCKFWIFKAFFDVKGHRHCREDIFAHCFVVDSHVQKHGFLIAQVEIIFKLIVQLHLDLVILLLLLLLLLRIFWISLLVLVLRALL